MYHTKLTSFIEFDFSAKILKTSSFYKYSQTKVDREYVYFKNLDQFTPKNKQKTNNTRSTKIVIVTLVSIFFQPL